MVPRGNVRSSSRAALARFSLAYAYRSSWGAPGRRAELPRAGFVRTATVVALLLALAAPASPQQIGAWQINRAGFGDVHWSVPIDDEAALALLAGSPGECHALKDTGARCCWSTDAAAWACGTNALAAANVSIVDAGGYFTGTSVEAMGQEVGAALGLRLTEAQADALYSVLAHTHVAAAISDSTAAGRAVLTAADAAAQRAALALGSAATHDAPASGDATATQTVLGADSRLTDARTPTSTLAHASTHAAAGSDALSGTLVVDVTGNAGTASAFDHNPAPCSSSQFATDQSAAGVLTCAPVGFSDLSGTGTPTQVGLSAVTNDTQTKASVMPNTAPSAGQVPVGNLGGTAYEPKTISGDATLASTGAVTVTKTNGVSFATSATTDATNASNLSSGTVPTARLGSGSATSATYLSGDQTWKTISTGEPALYLTLFGGGADGDVTCSSASQLARPMYYHNLTLSSGCQLRTNGFPIFVSGTLNATACPAEAIFGRGGTSPDSNGNGGTSANYFGQANPSANRTAGVGSGVSGSTGTSGNNTQGFAFAGATGASGAGGSGNGGANAGGAAGAVMGGVSSAFALQNLTTNLTRTTGGSVGVIFGGPGASAGGSGGGGTSGTSGVGGAGGGGIAPVAVFARTVNRGASTAAACITSRGGNGETGGSPAGGTNAGGGGGGGGGAGVWVYFVAGELTGSTATGMIDASGGNGGAGGNGDGTGLGGNGGNGGQCGRLDFYELSGGSYLYGAPGGAGTAGGARSGATGGTSGPGCSQRANV